MKEKSRFISPPQNLHILFQMSNFLMSVQVWDIRSSTLVMTFSLDEHTDFVSDLCPQADRNILLSTGYSSSFYSIVLLEFLSFKVVLQWRRCLVRLGHAQGQVASDVRADRGRVAVAGGDEGLMLLSLFCFDEYQFKL